MRLPVVEVRALLDDASAASAAFEKTTGLACPDGCGACCEAPTVEATPLELLPLAVAAYDAGDADALLDRLDTLEDPLRCALYEADPAGPGRGRCSRYEFRPLVCRLFGGAAFRHGTGRRELVTCTVRRTQFPDAVARADALLATDAEAPVFADHGLRFTTLDAATGAERLPINEALRHALEHEGLRRRFEP